MGYGKLRNRQVFRATVNNKDYTFTCYTQSTTHGFRHLCCEGYNDTDNPKYIKYDLIAKVVWCNRTWERFTYETVLKKAIDQMTESDREKLRAILIDKTAQDESEQVEKEVNDFKNLYDQTSDRFKEFAKDNIFMNNEDDLKAVKGLMLLDILMNK